MSLKRLALIAVVFVLTFLTLSFCAGCVDQHAGGDLAALKADVVATVTPQLTAHVNAEVEAASTRLQQDIKAGISSQNNGFMSGGAGWMFGAFGLMLGTIGLLGWRWLSLRSQNKLMKGALEAAND